VPDEGLKHKIYVIDRGREMKCPYCGNVDTKVVDSRYSEDMGAIRRRRECLNCGKRFTTYERVEIAPIIVIKKNGVKEEFDPEKIRKGMMRACEKRPISPEDIDIAVQEIEREIRQMESIEIPSMEIGELVMRKLRSMDKVAYIRFASVYREFEDVETFQKEINMILEKYGGR